MQVEEIPHQILCRFNAAAFHKFNHHQERTRLPSRLDIVVSQIQLMAGVDTAARIAKLMSDGAQVFVDIALVITVVGGRSNSSGREGPSLTSATPDQPGHENPVRTAEANVEEVFLSRSRRRSKRILRAGLSRGTQLRATLVQGGRPLVDRRRQVAELEEAIYLFSSFNL